MTDAFYELMDSSVSLGERFAASDFTTGSWDASVQNGAPVSALLVRALEHCSPRADVRLSRVVVDFWGPVPVCDELWVSARMDRPGSRIELLTAQMLAPGPGGQLRVVAKASAWRFAQHNSATIEFNVDPPLPPLGEVSSYRLDDDTAHTYVSSLHWCSLTDLHAVPAECWAKPAVGLVRGELLTPVERLFTIADVANGLGTQISMADWSFQNTDIAVHIQRVPEGDWVGVRAENNYGPDGVGVSAGTLFDHRGPVAKIQQTQLVRVR
ncbi:MAG: thioesterase family protein [Mycobacterium sp.]|nr:thioesterase family protein [Mycobacterium sp.]